MRLHNREEIDAALNRSTMVSGPSPQVIEAIRNAPSRDAQIASLRQLKNDLVGHEQRKELVVRHGIVEPLTNILATPTKAAGKRSANGVEPFAHLFKRATAGPWMPEEEAKVQGTLILASLANAGLAFVNPLLSGGIFDCLLDGLATDASRLTTASLQALRNLYASASLGHVSPGDEDDALGPLPIDSLQAMLKQPMLTPAHRQQQHLAAQLIALSATSDKVRGELANGGVLDTLASLLASYAFANKHIDYRGPRHPFPPPPPEANLPAILSAVAAITTGSNFRTQSFILSASMQRLFSNSPSDHSDSRFVFGARNGYQNPTDHLLPPLHVPVYKSVSFNASSSAFPALASLRPGDRRSGATLDTSQLAGDAEHANAVVSWLIFLARSMKGLDRLTALRLLALVNNAIEADALLSAPRSEALQRARERERQLAMLAIPLAVKLVQSASEEKNAEPQSSAQERENLQIQEEACEVLALLIHGSKDLQAAAVDAGAIKRVCPILKHSFDTITLAKPMWSAQPAPAEEPNLRESSKLGPRGLPPEIRHTMLCRRSALVALAALAKKEDVHRKAIVEAGVVSCIIDSLKPLTADFATTTAGAGKPPQQFAAKDGNTTAVILAACHAAQSMSRSVSLLRTSLIDAGIAKPVFELLKHSDPEVQIAATDVCCNLLLDFSPMKDDLLAAGAIKTLTEHARQSEMGLRLASLWALKHLVLASSREIKIQCLDELGTGWLVGAVQGEQRDNLIDLSNVATGGVSVAAGGLSTPNAVGEQVDILNPPTTMDVDEPGDDRQDIEEEGEEEEEEEDEDGEVMYDEAAGTHYQASQLRSTLHRPSDNTFSSTSASFNSTRYLSSVKELEQNPVLQAKRDDVAVQEQALDFIRNMLNGDDCAYMFEHLLRAVGQDKVFSLLTEKLAPVLPASYSTTPRPNKPIYQPTELILSTVHVLTHIANGSPTHKQLLIAQKQLLANWLPHFNHVDRRVRVISVWAVNSLTWVEDDADRAGAVQRAKELRLCGIEAAIRGLAGDADLDVRERVKTAVRQIESL